MVLMIWHDFEKNVRYHENSQIAIRVSATTGFSNSPSSLTSILYDVECTWRVRNVRSEYKELPERCAGSRAEHTQGSHPACIITLNAMTTTLILLKSTQQATNKYANRMSKGSRQRLQSARYFYPLSWKTSSSFYYYLTYCYGIRRRFVLYRYKNKALSICAQ